MKNILILGGQLSARAFLLQKLMEQKPHSCFLDEALTVDQIEKLLFEAESVGEFCIVTTQLLAGSFPAKLLEKFDVLRCFSDRINEVSFAVAVNLFGFTSDAYFIIHKDQRNESNNQSLSDSEPSLSSFFNKLRDIYDAEGRKSSTMSNLSTNRLRNSS